MALCPVVSSNAILVSRVRGDEAKNGGGGRLGEKSCCSELEEFRLRLGVDEDEIPTAGIEDEKKDIIGFYRKRSMPLIFQE